MLQRVRDALRLAGGFERGGRMVLAVSGGADSLALLDLMAQVAPDFGLGLTVAHIDHGIHPDSQRVAEGVRETAARYDLPCHVISLGLGAAASETKARAARYEALFSLRAELGAEWIATAHHADDQVETVLFRALKGSGPLGLAGIRPHGTGNRGVFRPLLGFRKQELVAWLATSDRAAVPHDDPANTDLKHDRAWVRSRLLPAIRDRFGPEADERLLALGRHAELNRKAWSSVLGALAELEYRTGPGAAELARPPMVAYDKPLSLAILRAAALELGCVIGPSRADRLHRFVVSSTSGRRFELGGGWICEIVFDRIRLAETKPGPAAATSLVWGRETAGCVQWHDWVIEWGVEAAGEIERQAMSTWVTPGEGTMRGPRSGDRLRPYRGVGKRRVVRLLTEGRVPFRDREVFPVLARNEEILWLPGVCRAEAAVPRPGEMAVRLDARHLRP